MDLDINQLLDSGIILLIPFLVILMLLFRRRKESPQPTPDEQKVPEKVSDFDEVSEAFIAYIERESAILRLDNFGSSDYIGYESGYAKENDYRQIWIAAWLPADHDAVAAVLSIQSDSRYFESHYKKFEEHKGKIEDTFLFEDIKFRGAGRNVSHLRVVKEGVDLTQIANWDTEFRWLCENLEKLYWVLRVHDTLGWDTATSTKNPSEDDLPF